jgi:hypothetical protein
MTIRHEPTRGGKPLQVRFMSLPLLVVLALAGCANGQTGESAGSPATAPTSAASPAPTSPAATAEESATTKPPAAGPKTLTGTITAGVEPGCLLLDDHLLIINDAELRSAARTGATVTVTGRVEPGMMTTCQQGTPFVVTGLRAN